ncbi:MAG: hypothetical protein ACRCUT_01345, partial [Spirochaetota bacterium]
SYVTYSPPCGKIDWFDDYYSPAADFPYLCLSDDDKILNAANWPDLVPHFRAKTLKYMPGTTAAQTAFAVTEHAIVSNVATLTLSNLTAEKAILAALAEDQLVHGSFTAWRTVTLPADIGSIVAGTYEITAISAANRTLSFSYTGENASAAVTSIIEIYPHRVASSIDAAGTMARHFAVKGRTIVSPNDSAGECISGLRRRDRMQPITGSFNILDHGSGGLVIDSVSGAFESITGTTAGAYNISGTIAAGRHIIKFNSASAPNARTGNTTDSRALILIPYMWGKRYAA